MRKRQKARKRTPMLVTLVAMIIYLLLEMYAAHPHVAHLKDKIDDLSYQLFDED